VDTLWDNDFESLVRAELGTDDPLEPDQPLAHYGLTSLGCLTLGRKLAERYDVPMRSFGPRTFRTARSLWTFVTTSAEDAAAPVTVRPGVRPRIRLSGKGIAHRFGDSAQRDPGAVCLISGGEAVTYGRMAREALILAGAISPGGVVAVLGERETATFRAYLAVLFAGATVVPLSLDSPPERNADIVTQAGARCVIHSGLDPLSRAQLAALDGIEVLDGTVVPEADPVAPADVSLDAFAYLLFTSGSTGRPKGVGITHANLDAYLANSLPRYDVGGGDVFSQCHELTFDLSVFELWGAWTTGAALLPVSRTRALDPAATVAEHGVTVWTCTPSLMAAAAPRPDSLAGLRYVVFCGEPLPRETARKTLEAAPESIVDNTYGPTEATVWCTYLRLPPALPDEAIVPIGSPCPGVDVRISDEGELWLAGPQVFGGYLDPALDRFAEDGWYRTGDRVRRDEAGVLHHLGRLDDQLKIRGYRVEPAEIEHTAARLLGGTRTAAVVVAGELVLFVEAASVDSGTLRVELARTLPGYMVPSRVLAATPFPLTANAKLDRSALARLS
jgi:amino acid adenylation domain-containing protein